MIFIKESLVIKYIKINELFYYFLIFMFIFFMSLLEFCVNGYVNMIM